MIVLGANPEEQLTDFARSETPSVGRGFDAGPAPSFPPLVAGLSKSLMLSRWA